MKKKLSIKEQLTYIDTGQNKLKIKTRIRKNKLKEILMF